MPPGEGADAFVRGGAVAKGGAESVRPRDAAGRRRGAGARGGVEGAGAVPRLGVALGGGEAAALAGGDVQQHRHRGGAQGAEGVHEERDVVAVERPHVAQAELFENGVAAAGEKRLEAALDGVVLLAHPAHAQAPHAVVLEAGLPAVVAGAREHAAEGAREGADGGADGHLVVVEDDEEAGRGVAHVVERFERNAVRDRGVAHDGDDGFAAAAAVARGGEAERGGNRVAGVAGAEGVAGRFVAALEAGEAARAAQRGEAVAAAGEELVGVALVRNVEEDFVFGRIEDIEQRDRELHDAEVGGEVPAVGGDDRDDALPELGGELREALDGEAAQVRRGVDLVEKRHGGGGRGGARYFASAARISSQTFV